MIYAIKPLKGVNNIEFGMTVDEVRGLMPGQYETFIRGAAFEEFKDKFPSDHYVDNGAFCYYDADGRLEAMEFSEPARPLLGDLNLLDISFRHAASVLAKLDPDVTRDSDMVWSRRLSLSIWTSKTAAEPVEAFLVGKPGYYDGMV